MKTQEKKFLRDRSQPNMEKLVGAGQSANEDRGIRDTSIRAACRLLLPVVGETPAQG